LWLKDIQKHRQQERKRKRRTEQRNQRYQWRCRPMILVHRIYVFFAWKKKRDSPVYHADISLHVSLADIHYDHAQFVEPVSMRLYAYTYKNGHSKNFLCKNNLQYELLYFYEFLQKPVNEKNKTKMVVLT
jgi:hypothetical protein